MKIKKFVLLVLVANLLHLHQSMANDDIGKMAQQFNENQMQENILRLLQIANPELRAKLVNTAVSIFPNRKRFRTRLLRKVSSKCWGLGEGTRLFDEFMNKYLDDLMSIKDEFPKMENNVDRNQKLWSVFRQQSRKDLLKESLMEADTSILGLPNAPKGWLEENCFRAAKLLDFSNCLSPDIRQMVIKTVRNSFPDDFGSQIKFLKLCAKFMISKIQYDVIVLEAFLHQKLHVFLKNNELQAMSNKEKLKELKIYFSDKRFYDYFYDGLYHHAPNIKEWWKEETEIDLCQFEKDGAFPWDKPCEALLDVLNKAPRATNYPGLAPPSNMTNEQVIAVHKAFTNSLQCLDVLDKPYLCKLEVFAKLAKVIFRRMVLENAADYIPKDEINSFKDEIYSMQSMSFMYFTILMDRISVLLTHPQRRLTQAIVTNVMYDYYSTWLSSQGKKYMNHEEYAKLVATRGNSFTRKLSSTWGQIMQFPYRCVFVYLLALEEKDLVGCLTTPKGTVLPEYLKEYDVQTDNFRPAALVYGPIDHDTHIKATPAHYMAHDRQHDSNMRTQTSTVTLLMKIQKNPASFKEMEGCTHDFVPLSTKSIRQQHNLYHAIAACFNIFIDNAKSEKLKKYRAYISLTILHELTASFRERLKYITDKEELYKAAISSRESKFRRNYYKPFDPDPSITHEQLLSKTRSITDAFIDDLHAMFPDLIADIEVWKEFSYQNYVLSVMIGEVAYNPVNNGSKFVNTKSLEYNGHNIPFDFYLFQTKLDKDDIFFSNGNAKPMDAGSRRWTVYSRFCGGFHARWCHHF